MIQGRGGGAGVVVIGETGLKDRRRGDPGADRGGGRGGGAGWERGDWRDRAGKQEAW